MEAVGGIISVHSEAVVKGSCRPMTVRCMKAWETSLPYFKRKRFAQNNGCLEISFSGGDEGDGERAASEEG